MIYVKDQESGGPHPKGGGSHPNSGGSHPTSDVERNLEFAEFSPLTTFSSRITISGISNSRQIALSKSLFDFGRVLS